MCSTTVSLNRPGRQSAAWHEAEAGNYRRQADLLLEQNAHQNSAGALLYEAAKQCINAVANQQGSNPGATRAKVRFLDDIVERGLSTPDLIDNWQAAANLRNL